MEMTFEGEIPICEEKYIYSLMMFWNAMNLYEHLILKTIENLKVYVVESKKLSGKKAKIS